MRGVKCIEYRTTPFESKQKTKGKKSGGVNPYLTLHFLYRGNDPKSGCISGDCGSRIWKWYYSNPDVSVSAVNFCFWLDLASLIVQIMYSHQTLLSLVVRNPRQHIFSGRDYGMPYTGQTLNKTKKLLAIHFICKSSIPHNHKKNGCRWKKEKEKDMAWSKTSQSMTAIEPWNLISFIFLHKF